MQLSSSALPAAADTAATAYDQVGCDSKNFFSRISECKANRIIMQQQQQSREARLLHRRRDDSGWSTLGRRLM